MSGQQYPGQHQMNGQQYPGQHQFQGQQPQMQQMGQPGAQVYQPNIPKEKYCGPISLIIGIFICPCICFCPIDERPAGTMMPAVQAQPYYPPQGQPGYPPQGQQGYPPPGYPPQKDPGMPAAF